MADAVNKKLWTKIMFSLTELPNNQDDVGKLLVKVNIAVSIWQLTISEICYI